jgi:transcriptional regulator with XRE-family HTH domain
MSADEIDVPAASKAEDQEGSFQLGTALRNRRRHLKMTLATLSEACGLSVPFLSQLENNRAAPSVASLLKLAEALGVGIDHFVNVPRPQEFVRRAATPVVMDLGVSIRYEKLGADHEGSALEAFVLHVPAGQGHPKANREGEGFWYILSGKLEMTVGDESFSLGPGDSAHFDQRHFHSARASDEGPVKLVWVGTPRVL